VVEAIAHTNVRKAPGYVLISTKVLKELPKKAATLLTILYDDMLCLFYYPLLWKFAQIIMVPKPGKFINDVTSYGPISLLPIPLKIFENLPLKRSEVMSTSRRFFLITNLAFELVIQPSIKRAESSTRSLKA
jgi:hypothetical protein